MTGIITRIRQLRISDDQEKAYIRFSGQSHVSEVGLLEVTLDDNGKAEKLMFDRVIHHEDGTYKLDTECGDRAEAKFEGCYVSVLTIHRLRD